MKDKEKQINDLGNTLYNRQDKYDLGNPFEVAKCVIDLGYKKIDKDSVVLTKEELKEVKNIEKTYYKKVVIPQERKETAEKIYLQAKAIIDCTKHIVQGREYLHIDALKEIIKSCGVEIKE